MIHCDMCLNYEQESMICCPCYLYSRKVKQEQRFVAHSIILHRQVKQEQMNYIMLWDVG